MSATLVREGVDISGLQTRRQVATPVCVCLVGDDGRTSFLWHIAEEAEVAPETVHAAAPAIEHADVVLVTFEMPVSTIREAINLAHRHGALVVFQPAPVLANPSDAASLPWHRVDVVVPNVIEARALLSDSHPEHAEEHFNDESMLKVLAQDLGVSMIVVTLAEAGCLTYSSGVTRRYPAQQPTGVVDTTGASDAFTAALALKLGTAAPECDAIDTALSAAAHVISKPGGYESMPDRTVV